MRRLALGLVLLMLLLAPLSFAAQGTKKPPMVMAMASGLFTQVSSDAIEIKVDPPSASSTYKRGQRVTFTITVTNKLPTRQMTLQATATYTDSQGVQRTVTSNTVTLTIDDTITIATLSIPVSGLSSIQLTDAAGNAVPNTVISNSSVTISSLDVPQSAPVVLKLTGTIQ